jgi:hypothetical protein
MKTPHDMTVYHRTVALGAEGWTREQIQGVLWERRTAATVTPAGMLMANLVTVYVPAERDLSVAPGDVLVKGIVTDVIGGAFTMASLKAKYADVVTVRTVDDLDFGSSGMQHLEIGAS